MVQERQFLDLEMCFVPLACTCSASERPKAESVSFDFGMCFVPLACTFGTALLPKVVRHCGVFGIDLEMCFAPQRRAIFHLSSPQMAPHPPLSGAYFFDRPEPQNMWKSTVFATFPPFRAPGSSLFSNLSSAFLFSDSSGLTSKLLSMGQ